MNVREENITIIALNIAKKNYLFFGLEQNSLNASLSIVDM